MRWKGRRGSENIEDRRGAGAPIAMGGGGLMILVVIGLIYLCMGGDLGTLLKVAEQMPQQAPVQQQAGEPGDEPQDEAGKFVSVVLGDTEDVWSEIFRQQGAQYRKPTLVLFEDRVTSACGFQSAATGPFYCPRDEKVYIDLSFFQQMRQQLGAPGDFAQAYVIAHEVGHHVQNLLGTSDQVHDLQRSVAAAEANELSVRLELQADFYAGVWANHAQQNWNILEEGDIEEALGAANAIGDDRLQRESRGYVVPESFTHGTSQQRVRWFTRGLRTGDVDQGDTFSVPYDEL